MAVPRTRSRTHAPTIGTYYSKSGASTTVTRVNEGDSVSDMVEGFGTDNYLSLLSNKREGAVFNGQRPPGLFHPRKWVNVPYSGIPAFGEAHVLVPPESEDNAARRAFNITNPGRADILLPVFWLEFKDIPRMVRQLGDTLRWIHNGIRRPPTTIASGLSLLKKTAADNLAYQFGWSPLLSDLIGLSKFTTALQSRKNELTRLHQGNGLKRRITLDKREVSVKFPNSITVWSTDGTLLTMPGNQVEYRSWARRWATLRYTPTSDSPLPSMDQEIRLMMSGLTLNNIGTNLWEAIPWSWLADYFSNLGDLITATNNSAHVRVSSCCVMSNYGWSYSFPQQVWDGGPGDRITLSPYMRTYETKMRKVGLPTFPMPEIGLPHLAGRQLSILGSLAVMRIGR